MMRWLSTRSLVLEEEDDDDVDGDEPSSARRAAHLLAYARVRGGRGWREGRRFAVAIDKAALGESVHTSKRRRAVKPGVSRSERTRRGPRGNETVSTADEEE